MNVGELKKLLAPLSDDLPVAVEVTFDDGDQFESADLQRADVETRCDDTTCLYLWGDQNEPQYKRAEDEEEVST